MTSSNSFQVPDLSQAGPRLVHRPYSSQHIFEEEASSPYSTGGGVSPDYNEAAFLIPKSKPVALLRREGTPGLKTWLHRYREVRS